jgi:hypothetical protein
MTFFTILELSTLLFFRLGFVSLAPLRLPGFLIEIDLMTMTVSQDSVVFSGKRAKLT